jgi:hypothetical protein
LKFDGAKADFSTNFLTVDTLCWSEDGKNYSEPLLCNELNTLLLNRRYEGKLWLRYGFDIQDVPEKMRIIAEKSDSQHLVNGHQIHFDHTLEEDHCFQSADISAFVRAGENYYETVMNWHQSEATYYALFGEGVTESLRNCIAYDSEIEAVYLAGHFGVYARNTWEKHDEKHLLGSKFYIGKAPEIISETVTDGLPFFRGQLTLTQKVDLIDPDIQLALAGDFLTAKIAVNGQYAGEIYTKNTVDISRFAKEGENEISATFCIGNRNVLGPFHAGEEEVFVCPTLFEESNIPATENGDPKYKFRTFYP